MPPRELHAPSVGAVVGQNLQELRGRRGWTQDDTAKVLREAGMSWSRDQVAFLESGRREDVQVSELILLSAVFEVPLRRWFHGGGFVQLARLKLGTLENIRSALGPEPLGPGAIWSAEPGKEKEPPEAGTKPGAIRLYRPIPSRSEQNAARKLNVDPVHLHEVGMRLWERGLDEERDRRLGERGDLGTSKGAYRGHVTRTLVEELRRALHEPGRGESTTRRVRSRPRGRSSGR